MKNLVTKNNALMFIVGAFILVQLAPYIIQSDTCGIYLNMWWQFCKTIKDALFPLYILVVPIIILYFLSEEIFRSWVRFNIVWAPLSIFLVVFNGPYNNLLFPGSSEFSKILGCATVMMSLLLFAIKSWELRRRDQGNQLAWWITWASLIASFIASIVLSIFIYGLMQ